MIAENLKLTADNEYVIIATETTSEDNDYYYRSVGGKKYDIIKAVASTANDGGLTEFEKSSIEGVIWNDKNYDGIRSADETGIENVPVKLTRYYHNGTEWIEDTEYESPSVQPSSDGKYTFENLETNVKVEENVYLASYKLKVENLPEGYAVTKPHVGEDQTVDSDLTAETLDLTANDEYIIIATETTSDDNAYYYRQVGDKKYDIIKAKPHAGNDGGLTEFENTSIEGVIWNDADYNGIQDKNEAGFENINVILSRYYYDGFEWKEDTEFIEQICATNSEGMYIFENLETSVLIDENVYLASYKLRVESLPEGYAVTRYQVGEDKNADNDMIAETLSLTSDDEYIIVAAETNSDDNVYYCREVGEKKYDIIKSKAYIGNDGGLTDVEKTSIEGVIWNDVNYDGVRDDNETVGFENVEVKLTRYYHDGNEWLEDTDFEPLSAFTNADGKYVFDNLDVSVVKEEQTYLAGYKLKVESLPEGYAITKYHAGKDKAFDSDLITDTLNLTTDDEYIVIAIETTAEDNKYYYRKVNDKKYDIIKANTHSGSDGGLTEIETS